MYEWLRHYQSNILVVATKMDKIKRSQVQKNLSIIRKELAMDNNDILIPFSSVTKQGKEEIWNIFKQWIIKEE